MNSTTHTHHTISHTHPHTHHTIAHKHTDTHAPTYSQTHRNHTLTHKLSLTNTTTTMNSTNLPNPQSARSRAPGAIFLQNFKRVLIHYKSSSSSFYLDILNKVQVVFGIDLKFSLESCNIVGEGWE